MVDTATMNSVASAEQTQDRSALAGGSRDRVPGAFSAGADRADVVGELSRQDHGGADDCSIREDLEWRSISRHPVDDVCRRLPHHIALPAARLSPGLLAELQIAAAAAYRRAVRPAAILDQRADQEFLLDGFARA